MEGRIINITRFCTDDGPGIRTTVFLKGCPLRCAWCHNPESQNSEDDCYESGETVGKTVTALEVFETLKRDKIFYETSGGGATVSGGEPLYQPEFTGEILRLCKEAGIRTAVETSGFASSKSVETALQNCDLVLFDIKETDPQKHLRFTGVPLEPIYDNLTRINEMGIPFVIRLPIIPGFNDRKAHFLAVRELVRGLKQCTGIEVMPYHTLGEYKYKQLGREYLCKEAYEPGEEQKALWYRWLRE